VGEPVVSGLSGAIRASRLHSIVSTQFFQMYFVKKDINFVQ
jgi:hypothetical protein